MRIVLVLIFSFLSSITLSQELDYKDITVAENYILNNKKDSALHYVTLLKQKSNDPYLGVLDALTRGDSVSYNDFHVFSVRIYKNHIKSRDTDFFKFINTIPIPKNEDDINLDYVYTKWLYITRLRDIVQLEKANIENKKLENYISQFDNNSVNYQKAQLLLDVHDIVLDIIKKDLKGKPKCLKNIEQAVKLKDKKIEAIYLGYLCDFYILERDLDAYIATAEKSIAIQRSLPVKTFAFEEIVGKLIDAYLFKGGKNVVALSLLEELYNNPESRTYSYSLYANLLRNIDTSNTLNQKIFNQFKVDNVIQFCEKIENKSVDALDPNRFYFVLNQNSLLLQKRGYLEEAIAYKSKCIKLREKIYSEDLANSLYSYKSEQKIKQKELEVQHEKEKANLYTSIAIASISSLLILVFIAYKMFRQTKELKKKNQKIVEQRDAIAKKEREKALLLKEVHHRVKNNFQIISSLLELQTKGIEDKKALELAEEGKCRVKSMALIHQKLYQNEDLLIEFDEYVKSLVKDISSMYGKDKNPNINIDVSDCKFDIDTAIPLGLIINELITNAYKYGFGLKEQTLDIIMDKASGEDYTLKIKDNGVGLPKGFNFEKAKSLGLRLVRRLSKQLQGSTTYNYDNGSIFSIQFKDTNARAKID